MKYLPCLIVLLFAHTAFAQKPVVFEKSVSVGILPYISQITRVDPGPGWRGDYLPDDTKPGL